MAFVLIGLAAEARQRSSSSLNIAARARPVMWSPASAHFALGLIDTIKKWPNDLKLSGVIEPNRLIKETCHWLVPRKRIDRVSGFRRRKH
jgi:hypothetical protein